MKLILSKKLYSFPKKNYFFIVFFYSLIIGALFFTAAFIEGLGFQTRTDYISNYSSHIQIKSSTYQENNKYSTNNWWFNSTPALDNAVGIPNIRAVTTRTTTRGLYNDQPIQVTGIKYQDNELFNPRIYSSAGSNIPIDSANIGCQLARKNNLSIGSRFPVELLDAHVSLSNLTVGFIMPSINPFIDNHGVYINQNSIPSPYAQMFTDYHIRYAGSAFDSLIVSNITASSGAGKIIQPDSNLQYSYEIINELKNIVYSLAKIIFFLLGFLYYFLLYKNQFFFHEDFNQVLYKQGFLYPPNPLIKFLISGLSCISLSTLIAFIGINITNIIPIEILADIFVSPTGIYENLALPINYFVTLSIDPFILFQLCLEGIIIFMIGLGVCGFIFYLIKKIAASPNIVTVYSIVLIIIALGGFLSTKELFLNISANKGRQQQWVTNFFGDYTLFNKNYLANMYFQTPQILFRTPTTIYERLTNRRTPYLASTELKANHPVFIYDGTNNITGTNYTPLNITALQHYNYPYNEELLNAIDSNEVVLGTNLSLLIGSDKILNLSYSNTQSQTNIFTVLAVNKVVDFTNDHMNNTLFISPQRMLALGITNQATKIQVLKTPIVLTQFTNTTTIIQSAKESYQIWQPLSNTILYAQGLTTILSVITWFIIIMLIIIYYKTLDKSLLLFHYIWGYKNHIPLPYFTLPLAAFSVGIFISWILPIYNIIYGGRLPKFLENKALTIGFTSYGFDFIGFMIIILCAILMTFLCFGIANLTLKKITVSLFKYSYKDNIS